MLHKNYQIGLPANCPLTPEEVTGSYQAEPGRMGYVVDSNVVIDYMSGQLPKNAMLFVLVVRGLSSRIGYDDSF